MRGSALGDSCSPLQLWQCSSQPSGLSGHGSHHGGASCPDPSQKPTSSYYLLGGEDFTIGIWGKMFIALREGGWAQRHHHCWGWAREPGTQDPLHPAGRGSRGQHPKHSRGGGLAAGDEPDAAPSPGSSVPLAGELATAWRMPQAGCWASAFRSSDSALSHPSPVVWKAKAHRSTLSCTGRLTCLLVSLC